MFKIRLEAFNFKYIIQLFDLFIYIIKNQEFKIYHFELILSFFEINENEHHKFYFYLFIIIVILECNLTILKRYQYYSKETNKGIKN